MKSLNFILIVFLAASCSAYSQSCATKDRTKGFFLEAGYNTFTLKEISDVYESAVAEYSGYGVPMKIQKLFPGNIVFGGGIYFSVKNNLDLQLGLHYTSSKAYAFYSDYSGSVDIIGKVESFNLNIGLQKRIPSNLFFTPFFEFDFGLSTSNGYIEEKITAYNVLYEDKFNYTTDALYVRTALGGMYNINQFGVYIKSGYKLLLLLTRENQGMGSIDINMSGFFIMSGVSFTF